MVGNRSWSPAEDVALVQCVRKYPERKKAFWAASEATLRSAAACGARYQVLVNDGAVEPMVDTYHLPADGTGEDEEGVRYSPGSTAISVGEDDPLLWKLRMTHGRDKIDRDVHPVERTPIQFRPFNQE